MTQEIDRVVVAAMEQRPHMDLDKLTLDERHHLKVEMYQHIAKLCLITTNTYSDVRLNTLVRLIEQEIDSYDSKWFLNYCEKTGHYQQRLKDLPNDTGNRYLVLSNLLAKSRQQMQLRISNTVCRFVYALTRPAHSHGFVVH